MTYCNVREDGGDHAAIDCRSGYITPCQNPFPSPRDVCKAPLMVMFSHPISWLGFIIWVAYLFDRGRGNLFNHLTWLDMNILVCAMSMIEKVKHFPFVEWARVLC